MGAGVGGLWYRERTTVAVRRLSYGGRLKSIQENSSTKYCQLCGYDGDFVNERQYEEELCYVVSKNRPD